MGHVRSMQCVGKINKEIITVICVINEREATTRCRCGQWITKVVGWVWWGLCGRGRGGEDAGQVDGG